MGTKKSLSLAGHLPPVAVKVLVQTRVNRDIFNQIQQRAAIENRSIANFLEHWLECTFDEYNMMGEKKVSDG